MGGGGKVVMAEIEVGVAKAGFNISGLEEVHERVSPRFARAEARARSLRYLEALLGRVERKNC